VLSIGAISWHRAARDLGGILKGVSLTAAPSTVHIEAKIPILIEKVIHVGQMMDQTGAKPNLFALC
jgi:hypothetical protein